MAKSLPRQILHNLLRQPSERLLALLYGRGWPAALAARFGGQPLPICDHQHVTLANAAAHRAPLRFAFASDFHAGPTTDLHVITTACRLLAQAKPDVLLLGGDFVSLHLRDLDRLIAALQAVHAPLGRFAVLGNHDYWADPQAIINCLETTGIQVLVNKSACLPAPYNDVWICGLDDDEGRPDAARTLAGAHGTRIVLMHSPEGLRALQQHPFDLAFCGHTHGGQIAWPNGQPIGVPAGRFNWQFPAGRFQVGLDNAQTLFVSRGVGSSTLPIRLFAVPDVIVCTIAWPAPAAGQATDVHIADGR
ncbi:MAG: metallophosphoesterase [Chloroflexales bacterium]|nr:metallophosphoesterase [Chloroflexales bacterium]